MSRKQRREGREEHDRGQVWTCVPAAPTSGRSPGQGQLSRGWGPCCSPLTGTTLGQGDLKRSPGAVTCSPVQGREAPLPSPCSIPRPGTATAHGPKAIGSVMISHVCEPGTRPSALHGLSSVILNTRKGNSIVTPLCK